MDVEKDLPKVQNERVPSLDGVRGIICFIVLLGHTQFKDGSVVLPAALIMMDIFFCISGYLITTTLLNEFFKNGAVSFRNFWFNRGLRILPAFLVYYVLGVGVYLATQFKPIVGDQPLLTIVSTGLFWSSWATAFGHKLGIYTITWSLSVEEQFYLLAPVALTFLVRRFRLQTAAWSLGAVIVGVVLYRIWIFKSYLATMGAKAAWERCYMALDTRADSILVGCLTAVLVRLHPTKLKVAGSLAGVCILAIGLILGLRDIPLARGINENSAHLSFMIYGGFSLVAVLSAMIVLHLQQFPSSLASRFFSKKLFVGMGLLSYSAYLWHTTVFAGLEILLKDFNQNLSLWLLKLILRFALLAGLAYLSYRFVELPFNQYRKRRNKKRPGKSPASLDLLDANVYFNNTSQLPP